MVSEYPGPPLTLPDNDKVKRYFPAWPLTKKAEDKGGGIDLSDGWSLQIKDAPGILELDIPIGDLTEKAFDFSTPVKWIINHENKYACQELLRLSPYWLDAFAEAGLLHGLSNNLQGESRFQPFIRKVIQYRLTEICIKTIELWNGEKSLFSTTRILLLRQKFRYLAAIQSDWNSFQEFFEGESPPHYLPNFETLVSQARYAYSKALMEVPDEVEIALNAALVGSANCWDMGSEEKMMIINPNSGEPWPFSMNNKGDQILTDQILRKRFLAQDDLNGAAHILACLNNPNSNTKSPFFHYHRDSIISSFSAFLILIISSLLPEDFSLKPLWFEYFQIAVILIFIFFLISPIFQHIQLIFLSAKLGVMKLYPLALRIPAMGLVGILAIIGLTDSFIAYCFSAFDDPLIASIILALILGMSFLYVLVEVYSRSNNWFLALKRSLLIWIYSLSNTIWMALIVGILAKPIGLLSTKVLEKVKDSERFIQFNGLVISLDFVVFMSALALLVGVFTQIFWEDKSIAEPL